jgi:deoxyribonuclease-4
MILGAHVSIAGGIENAISHAESLGCETFQLFTKNQNQWKERHFSEEEIRKFNQALAHSNQNQHVLAAHDSYLINLCADNQEKLTRSRQAFVAEIERCDQLKIAYLIFHPGSHLGHGVDRGIDMVCESINWAIARAPHSTVRLLVETTAGQGTNLGYQLEQISRIAEGVEVPDRIGVCLDTCHVFSAGYDIRTGPGFQAFILKISDIIGLEKIFAFHLNDSKRELGSRIDRHEEIGKGKIGLDVFRVLVNDKRFEKVPGFLEIPGGEKEYKANLMLLKSLRI